MPSATPTPVAGSPPAPAPPEHPRPAAPSWPSGHAPPGTGQPSERLTRPRPAGAVPPPHPIPGRPGAPIHQEDPPWTCSCWPRSRPTTANDTTPSSVSSPTGERRRVVAGNDHAVVRHERRPDHPGVDDRSRSTLAEACAAAHAAAPTTPPSHDHTEEVAMNEYVPRTGHPGVDSHVAELFRQARLRARPGDRVSRGRPRRRR